MQVGPGLVIVKHLAALTSLNMSETNVSDAELSAVSNLKHLRKLFAGKIKITSAGKCLLLTPCLFPIPFLLLREKEGICA